MTIRSVFILMLMWLSAAALCAQSAVETRLRADLAAATADTARARLSGALAWEVKFTHNDEAWTLAANEVKLAKGDPLLLADGYRTMGLVRVVENKTQEGLELYKLAIENARKGKSEFYEASCNSLTAGMYQDMGDYDRSLLYYIEGLKVAERGKSLRMITTICNNIASIYDAIGREPSMSRRYYRRALEQSVAMKSYATRYHR